MTRDREHLRCNGCSRRAVQYRVSALQIPINPTTVLGFTHTKTTAYVAMLGKSLLTSSL